MLDSLIQFLEACDLAALFILAVYATFLVATELTKCNAKQKLGDFMLPVHPMCRCTDGAPPEFGKVSPGKVEGSRLDDLDAALGKFRDKQTKLDTLLVRPEYAKIAFEDQIASIKALEDGLHAHTGRLEVLEAFRCEFLKGNLGRLVLKRSHHGKPKKSKK